MMVSDILVGCSRDYFKPKYKKIMFEDIQYAIRYPEQFIIINTMPINEQECLIKHTIPYNMEEKYINDLLASFDLHSKKLFIYGKTHWIQQLKRNINN